MKKIICVLFGGKSSEYEVSLSSSHAVLSNIDRSRYEIVCIGITKDGKWYHFDGDIDAIRTGTWCSDTAALSPVHFSPNDGKLHFLPAENGKAPIASLRPDAVFPVLHGKFGEDGTMQGLFAVCGIPVVGCGCTSSGVCMDKAFTKSVVTADTDIPQAPAVCARPSDMADMDTLRRRCEEKFGYPMFVKPCAAGSSVGVSKVKDAAHFAAAVEKAFAEDTKILIEKAIVGTEVEVAVFESHGEYFTARPAEIDLGSSEFYDYETKYISDASGYYLPARLTAEEEKTVQAYALAIFKALDCRVFARVDFFHTADGFVFNEINTIPCFTPISMYPKMMMQDGMSYAELIDRILDAAL